MRAAASSLAAGAERNREAFVRQLGEVSRRVALGLTGILITGVEQRSWSQAQCREKL